MMEFATVSKRLAKRDRGSKAGEDVSDDNVLVHSLNLPAGQGGKLLHLARETANWEWMSFFVRRLQPGETYQTGTDHEEAAFVILGGTCQADWGRGSHSLGKRRNVFDGFPYTLYLPAGNRVTFSALTICKIAECRVPSQKRLQAALVTPSDVVTSLRGGGNASRQIVDVIPPAFPADKLMVVEVYTPGGNWSSYPPHKHDVHNPPAEVDLDEIYYFRTLQPEAFAFQHLYLGDYSNESTLKARDGDSVLVRSGYHTVVAGPGYDVLPEFSRRLVAQHGCHRRPGARVDSFELETRRRGLRRLPQSQSR